MLGTHRRLMGDQRHPRVSEALPPLWLLTICMDCCGTTRAEYGLPTTSFSSRKTDSEYFPACDAIHSHSYSPSCLRRRLDVTAPGPLTSSLRCSSEVSATLRPRLSRTCTRKCAGCPSSPNRTPLPLTYVRFATASLLLALALAMSRFVSGELAGHVSRRGALSEYGVVLVSHGAISSCGEPSFIDSVEPKFCKEQRRGLSF
mmetsp:Transcript_52456/g.87010  ORF Transcript_52456/g.87010 Transcript_52456/m.87010 type:complete len:202 (+) Transcript_52456:36-641(+)